MLPVGFFGASGGLKTTVCGRVVVVGARRDTVEHLLAPIAPHQTVVSSVASILERQFSTIAGVTFDGLQVAALTGGAARGPRFAELVPVSAAAAVRDADPAPSVN